MLVIESEIAIAGLLVSTGRRTRTGIRPAALWTVASWTDDQRSQTEARLRDENQDNIASPAKLGMQDPRGITVAWWQTPDRQTDKTPLSRPPCAGVARGRVYYK